MPLFIDIKVVPLSGRKLCSLDAQGTIKCYLISPPEKGKANKELVALLAKKLGIPQQDITIVVGATSRKKRVKIERNIEYNEVLVALGLEVQRKIIS